MRKFSKRFLTWLLAAAMVFGLSGMTAFAAETDDAVPLSEEEGSDADAADCATECMCGCCGDECCSADDEDAGIQTLAWEPSDWSNIPYGTGRHGTIELSGESDQITLALGETTDITITPYAHVQYYGCAMSHCGPMCGDFCWKDMKGCCCGSNPVLRLADVSVESSNPGIISYKTSCDYDDLNETGDTRNGTLTLTGKREGTTTVTVTAKLYNWEDATSTFDITVERTGEEDPAAFAVYSADDNSLTFYTDIYAPLEGSTYNGKTATNVYEDVDEINATGTGGIPWYSNRTNVTSVVIDDSFIMAQPINLCDWFYGFTNATFSGLENIDTWDVTNMYGTFYNCSSETSWDGLSEWETPSVTNMSYMFYNCSKFTGADLSGWDTSNVTNMSYMFYRASALTSVSLSDWDASSVTSARDMFYGCSALTSADLSGWDTSNVTDMYGVFYDCSALESADLSGWSTSSVTTMRYMFDNCYALESVDVSDWDTSNVTNVGSMFNNCTSLEDLDLTGWDTEAVSGDYAAFATGCTALKHVELGENTNIFTNAKLVDQQTWYDSPTNGKVVSSNYLQDAEYPGEYWADTTEESTVDKQALQKEVNEAEALSPEDYTEESWAPFADALANAQDVLTDTDATQDEVDKALDALQSAKDDLEPVETPDPEPTPEPEPLQGLNKVDGQWGYYVNGEVDTGYTGFASNPYGDWYVVNGYIRFDQNTVAKDKTGKDGDKGVEAKGDWWYVVGSEVQHDFNGLANYKNESGWWYIKDGKVDFTHNGVDKNQNGWWYVENGKVDFSHNGVDKNQNGWWYIIGGKVQFDFTGLANYKNANGWWYIKDGKVDFSHNGVEKNKYGWWYVSGGKVDFSFNGRASNQYGTWNIVNGKVVFS